LRKFLLALLLFFATTAKAEIYIDVDAGNFDPIRAAVMDFKGATPELAKIGAEVGEIISSNLKRSGLFKLVPKNAYIEKSLGLDDTPAFPNWSVINTQILAFGEVKPAEKNKIAIEFRLWDIVGTNQLKGQIFITEKGNARRIAHIISDVIYKEMTGDNGYFDTRILYVSETGPKTDRTKRLAIMDQDGANLKYLTNGKIGVTTPAFSPNSQKIAYVTYHGAVPKVYIFDIETGTHDLVGDFPGMSFAPRFAPDGKRLIMSIATNGNSDIYEMDIATKKLDKLTNHIAIDTAPSYSPDGKKIAFISDRSGTPQLYTMKKSGAGVERISFGDGRYGDVAWSPRGDYLAFVKIKGNKFAIGVMFEDGTGERIVADGFMVESPTWSPNGRRIIFYEQRPRPDGDDDLILHSVDVTGYNHEVIRTPTKASDPAWSPLLE
jgi:TolB protein